MRIEDLDGPRVVPGSAEAMMEDMRWLGLDWDEGPDVGGPHAPYAQSERSARYEAALEVLASLGVVYPCTCSRREVAESSSAPHGVEGLGVRYEGTCREGPAHPGRPASMRFRMPEPVAPFLDRLHGEVDASAWGGDFVVRRADGLFAYQLAVVVDDIEMGITEVVRGDDLLPSTPRQIALHRVLGSRGEVPAFLHVPLLLGPDGQRLAKRHAAPTLRDHRGRGETPEKIVGHLAASLGLAGPGEALTPKALLPRFDVDALPRTPSIEPLVSLSGSERNP